MYESASTKSIFNSVFPVMKLVVTHPESDMMSKHPVGRIMLVSKGKKNRIKLRRQMHRYTLTHVFPYINLGIHAFIHTGIHGIKYIKQIDRLPYKMGGTRLDK